jgi:GNAT superfamily N-acetyltransferase
VHETASGDYPLEIQNEWSPPVTAERVAAYIATALAHETTLVAEIDGAVVGVGALVEAQSEVRAVYVSHSAARQGVGSARLREIEGLARARGCAELTFDSSLTAERFYLRNGYAVRRYAPRIEVLGGARESGSSPRMLGSRTDDSVCDVVELPSIRLRRCAPGSSCWARGRMGGERVQSANCGR